MNFLFYDCFHHRHMQCKCRLAWCVHGSMMVCRQCCTVSVVACIHRGFFPIAFDNLRTDSHATKVSNGTQKREGKIFPWLILDPSSTHDLKSHPSPFWNHTSCPRTAHIETSNTKSLYSLQEFGMPYPIINRQIAYTQPRSLHVMWSLYLQLGACKL